jgi:hypothetical protein
MKPSGTFSPALIRMERLAPFPPALYKLDSRLSRGSVYTLNHIPQGVLLSVSASSSLVLQKTKRGVEKRAAANVFDGFTVSPLLHGRGWSMDSKKGVELFRKLGGEGYFFFSFSSLGTSFSILLRASFMMPLLVAVSILMWPSPLGPNSSPRFRLTFASLIRSLLSSWLERP